jgi:succinyl-CoA synthetase beta subunit
MIQQSQTLLDHAIGKGQKALSEYEAKKFLAGFGIPVLDNVLCKTAEAASAAAARIGFPVVVKACSPDLLHKSEKQAVHLDLFTAGQVEAACRQLEEAGHTIIDGYLVERMLAGRRELVAGMVRDPQFGPCVMLGVGGVFTEVLDDSVFRVAPFDARDVQEMVSELRSAPLLDAFRGEAAVDGRQLCATLLALGEIGITCPRVAEIDINPLIVHSDGSITAADALVVLEKEPAALSSLSFALRLNP